MIYIYKSDDGAYSAFGYQPNRALDMNAVQMDFVGAFSNEDGIAFMEEQGERLRQDMLNHIGSVFESYLTGQERAAYQQTLADNRRRKAERDAMWDEVDSTNPA